MAASRLSLIVLGAPGAGKGTISSRICSEFKLAHLSTGDILRHHIANKTELGQRVSKLVSRGQLVSDEIISKVILAELRRAGQFSNAGWLLDGYPRTISQAKRLDAEPGVNVDRVVNLDVPAEEIVNRLRHRWVHPPSGRVYNLEYNAPKQSLKDDVTGEPLIQRPDDAPEVVLQRLALYRKQIKPIVDFYSSKNLLETFTGNTSDYLWPLIQTNLRELSESRGALFAPQDDGQFHYPSTTVEPVGHTGQSYAPDDYRRARFEAVTEKQVNKNFAIDLVAKEPVIVCTKSVVWSSGGDALGHPKVYINVDPPGVQDCGYSGRKFIKKKYYDEAKHGKSITYEQYLEDMAEKERIEMSA